MNGSLWMSERVWSGIGRIASSAGMSRNQLIEVACAELMSRKAALPCVVAVFLSSDQAKCLRKLSSQTQLSVQSLAHGIITNAIRSSDDKMVVASWVENAIQHGNRNQQD